MPKAKTVIALSCVQEAVQASLLPPLVFNNSGKSAINFGAEFSKRQAAHRVIKGQGLLQRFMALPVNIAVSHDLYPRLARLITHVFLVAAFLKRSTR